jgi:predicted dehydrogenase
MDNRSFVTADISLLPSGEGMNDTAVGAVLVMGCGSIGSRHIRNLKTLGVPRVIAYDSDSTRVERVSKDYGIEGLRELKDLEQVDAAFVCTSTRFHVSAASHALDLGAHLFIEKPISDSLEGVDELLQKARTLERKIMIGFNLRYHPCVQRIKSLLDEGRIGRVVGARLQFGQYLPDWHPWEDYRHGYSANKQLGGGVILDRVHELDYIRWLLGEFREVTCVAGKLSGLEIDTEDYAEILLRCETGAIVEVHLDYIQRVYSSTCQIIGEAGTILWDYAGRSVRCFLSESGEWREWPEPRGFDINQTYLEEIGTFFDVLDEKRKPPVNGEDGRRILQIALAAKRSAEEGRTIPL